MLGNNNGTPFNMPVVPAYGNGGGFGGFGDDWIALIIFAMIFGWGGFGYGGFGGGFGGGLTAGNNILASDFATLQRQLSDGFGSTESKLDSVNNGICSLGYDQLAQMNSINQNISNTGWNVERAIQNDTIANMQNQFGIMNAIADTRANCNNNYRSVAEQLNQCCCENEKIAMQTRYETATQNCATLQAIDKLGDRIIDRINQGENAAKDAKIAEQACVINNQYLLSQINKAPVPAYVVQNPYCQCNNGYPYGPLYNGTTIA